MKEKELNREERNKTVMETGALVMAEFYADWCPHCQKMMPIVKEFKELEKGKLEVVQINIGGGERSCRFVYGWNRFYFYPATERGGFVETIRRDELDRLRKVVEDVVG